MKRRRRFIRVENDVLQWFVIMSIGLIFFMLFFVMSVDDVCIKYIVSFLIGFLVSSVIDSFILLYRTRKW